MEPDFSGYATKAGLKCADGRVITPKAFEHQDQVQVPLVWQHLHDDPSNVLGHAILHARPDGMYAEGFFNNTDKGQTAKQLVMHGDVESLSIYANRLVEKAIQGAKSVLHGSIKEVSLVLSGANPGAKIENVRLAHADGDVETLDEDVIIHTGLALDHTVLPEEESREVEELGHADDDDDDETVEDVYNSMSQKQKDVTHFMIGSALEAAEQEKKTAEHSDTTEEGDLVHQEGTTDMSRNVFDQNGTRSEGPTLSHDDLKNIVENAQKLGSFKEAFLAHAEEYGIEDIDILFPDAKAVTSRPELIARRTEWVKGVIDGAKHSPFARIKSTAADLTAEEARARGYVKGSKKKDEIIKLLKRVTTPTTVYKKQKLDRDDIVDITELDVVSWLKWEMRFMLEEELARAILFGDGRDVEDEDKIDEDHLRPIAWDDEMYTHPITLPTNTNAEGMVEAIIRARKNYKGTGRPAFYTTDDIITDMLMIKNKIGMYVYEDEAALAAKLRVSSLIPVEAMESVPDLIGIMVNISDYTIGADKGGSISMFDDFDIDYNQFKYLIETRVSGALTKPKSAVVIKRVSGTTVIPTPPTFDEGTNTITIPTVVGVTYYNAADDSVMDAGANVITETTDVEARPDAGYNFPHNTDATWTFAYVDQS